MRWPCGGCCRSWGRRRVTALTTSVCKMVFQALERAMLLLIQEISWWWWLAGWLWLLWCTSWGPSPWGTTAWRENLKALPEETPKTPGIHQQSARLDKRTWIVKSSTVICHRFNTAPSLWLCKDFLFKLIKIGNLLEILASLNNSDLFFVFVNDASWKPRVSSCEKITSIFVDIWKDCKNVNYR